MRTDGSVVAAELAIEWDVSEDTVRRDLRALAHEGELQRVHGGAVQRSPAAGDYATRSTVAPGPKAAVARTAAAMITPGQTVFLDGGTTAAAICRALPDALHVTIATHSPSVALELVDRPNVNVLLIGGTLYRHSLVSIGAVAAAYINDLAVDTFFMGVSGVHPVHGLTTGDAEEAAIKRLICGRAVETFVLASSEKLGSALAHRVVPFDRVTAAITDATDPRTLHPLRKAGLAIVRTGPKAGIG